MSDQRRPSLTELIKAYDTANHMRQVMLSKLLEALPVEHSLVLRHLESRRSIKTVEAIAGYYKIPESMVAKVLNDLVNYGLVLQIEVDDDKYGYKVKW